MAYNKNTQRSNFTYWIEKTSRFERRKEFVENKIEKKPTDKQLQLYGYLKQKCEEVGVVPKTPNSESYIQIGKAVEWMKAELKKVSGFIYSNADFENWLKDLGTQNSVV